MKPPRSIVSLISSATEILYLLGAGQRVVGISHECDFPPAIAGKPRLTRSLVDASASSLVIDEQVQGLSLQKSALYTIDVELLQTLAPDLIITQAQCDVCAVRYEDVVAAVEASPALADCDVLALNPTRIADVLEDIRRIGIATDLEPQAGDVVSQLERRITQVREVTATLQPHERPRVTCLEWIDPPMLAANWTPELVAWAGGCDGLSQDGRHSTYAHWTDIANFDPEIVVAMPCGFDLSRAVHEAQVLAAMPAWKQLSAVRSGRVFAVDGNAYFNRSGPRLVDSLEILAHLVHPDRFAAPLNAPQQAWRRLTTQGARLMPEDA